MKSLQHKIEINEAFFDFYTDEIKKFPPPDLRFYTIRQKMIEKLARIIGLKKQLREIV